MKAVFIWINYKRELLTLHTVIHFEFGLLGGSLDSLSMLLTELTPRVYAKVFKTNFKQSIITQSKSFLRHSVITTTHFSSLAKKKT